MLNDNQAHHASNENRHQDDKISQSNICQRSVTDIRRAYFASIMKSTLNDDQQTTGQACLPVWTSSRSEGHEVGGMSIFRSQGLGFSQASRSVTDMRRAYFASIMEASVQPATDTSVKISRAKS